MRIIYQGDLHLRSTVPVNRIDAYGEAQFNKLRQLVGFANDRDATLMLGGDIFDTYKVAPEIVNKANEILMGSNYDIVAVVGQHDIPYHVVDLMKSPVQSLVDSGAIPTVGIGDSFLVDDDVLVHFCSWEQEVSDPIPGKFNILLGHISVFKGAVPFYWKGEGYTPKTLKEKYPGFQLYLCGDIHEPVVEDNVIVSGPMMRMSINHINYKPRCYLIDTDTMNITPLYYQIEEDVFNTPDEKIESTLNLDNLIDAMKSSAIGRESYERDCFALAGDDKEVKTIISEIFDVLN